MTPEPSDTARERMRAALQEVFGGFIGEVTHTEAQAVLDALEPDPTDRERTHWEGCWRERGHGACARERLLELEAEREGEEIGVLVFAVNEDGQALARLDMHIHEGARLNVGINTVRLIHAPRDDS